MKKALSLLLVLTLVLGMSVTSFAAISVAKNFEDDLYNGFGGQHVPLGDEVRPGFVDTYVLEYGDFTVSFGDSDPSPVYGYTNAAGAAQQWDLTPITTIIGTPGSPGSTTTTTNEFLQAKAISDFPTKGTYNSVRDRKAAWYASLGFMNFDGNTKVTVYGYAKKDLPKVVGRTRISKGANTIKAADLVYDDNARVKIEFVDPFPSNNTDGQEFDIWVYPVVDGKAWPYEEYGINWTGTLKNYNNEVDAATDYLDLYTGQIAVMVDTVREIRYDLGPGPNESDVVLVGRGIKGQKYWGVANNTVSETDAANMDQYDIDQVYHLDQRGGLDKVTDHVLLGSATKDDFVFDGELKYLGMGNAKLPYAATYYIADHMIEVAAEEEPTEEDEELDPLVVPPETGGDISAPAGIFDNPSTGA
jgi:hypothetical protein